MEMLAVSRRQLFGKATRILLLAFSLLVSAGCDDGSDYDVVLAGTVVDHTGKGVQDVDITFNWSDGGLRTVVTDADGHFTWGYDWWGSINETPPLRVIVTPAYPTYIFSPPQYDLDAENSHLDINFIAIQNN